MSKITYKKRKKYKYLLEEKYVHPTPIDIKPQEDIKAKFFVLTAVGELTIKEKYAWDGASGPAVDTKTIMRGSLVHDALYQAMREKHLGQEWRKKVDELFRDICIADKMSKPYTCVVYRAVRLCGAKYARPDLLYAP